MMKILLLLLPLSIALIFKFLQNHALELKTYIHKTSPTAEEALKGPEKARVWTRPSDGKDLEYFSVYSTDRNEVSLTFRKVGVCVVFLVSCLGRSYVA